MPRELPTYVEAVLAEWNTIAFMAYDGYERLGTGAVAIEPTGDSAQLLYAERDFFAQSQNKAVTDIIDAYDPEYEFLIHFDINQGQTRTIRIRTPKGGQHPKRIWFFEMLRRAVEAPDMLPEKLPTWFLEAMEKLEKAKKQEAPEEKA